MQDTTCAARAALSGTAILLALIPALAQAQKLELIFERQCVSIRAQDVTAGEVLGEWARLGATKVVNAHLLNAERLSLELDCVPEADAIERVLGSADGYMIRRRGDTAGASDFALISVFAASDVPVRAAIERDAIEERVQSHAEAAPFPSPADVTLSVPPTNSDDEADTKILANDATGRPPGSRPSHRHAVVPAAAPASADKLPAGRPEGARPGTPAAATPQPGAPAPHMAAPVGESHDVNGRPARRGQRTKNEEQGTKN
jgi:hypothetical protein